MSRFFGEVDPAAMYDRSSDPEMTRLVQAELQRAADVAGYNSD